ncbi:MAG: acyl carrier protein [Christensenella sp.]
MEKAKKILLLEEMLELDEGTLLEDTVLADIDEWDSMAKISLIVLVDEECGKVLTGDEIKAFVTVQDILNYMD